MRILCRDCGRDDLETPPGGPCPHCGAARLIRHPELANLSIAHLDCDAFYATIEKRDNPALANEPVLVGGRERGVVMACCYIARRFGVRSAMPMKRALDLCPQGVIVKPDMGKYRDVSRQVKALMEEVTPAIEPLSLDEAFLDLTGTQALSGLYPAQLLVDLQRRIEREIGITVSVGLSFNKFLAKIASDLDKPRGFAVLGRADAIDFLTDKPVKILWGVGPALDARLARDGITRVGELRAVPEAELVARYGRIGHRLARFALAQDDRRISTDRESKSISAETTFFDDLRDVEPLLDKLWPLCERVSRQLKDHGLAARTITLKMKTSAFRIRTRSRTPANPVHLASDIFALAEPLVRKEASGERFRLIGIGTKELAPLETRVPDLFDTAGRKSAKVEATMDALRERFGRDAVMKGRSLKVEKKR